MHNKPRLLTPGPTQIPEQVRLELSREMVHHRKPYFTSIMQELQADLRNLFCTEQPVLPLSCSGTGAMEAAIENLFSPGETVLVVEGGKFGERWTEISQKKGLNVVKLEVEWGEAVDPRYVEEKLDNNPEISGVLLQASETSTGVLHPVSEIGELLQNRTALLIVDGISAVGISPCPMDKWNIDCLITGSQKGIMLPPGLALISLSSQAWQKTKQVESGNYYFDLNKELEKSAEGQTAYTTAVSLIMGLKAALDLFFEQGMERMYQKYWSLTQMTRAGAKALGLQLLAEDNYTWGLTSIKIPPEVDGKELISRVAENYNITIAGGQNQLKGRIVRIAHMGYVDWSDILAGLYALQATLQEMGAPNRFEPNYLEIAMQAYEEAKKSPFRAETG
ncbi:MAG: pyridoxal-phosphate-dependent aminotransferase family protein [Thermodesulfobacteriota bacterium]